MKETIKKTIKDRGIVEKTEFKKFEDAELRIIQYHLDDVVVASGCTSACAE